MPLVSVVIPTYRHRKYVLDAVNSALRQSYTNVEIIVVNDGSPDDTADVLKPLMSSGWIRYVEQANHGPAIARNRGVSMARGSYIAFLDDDDIWPADKLAWQVGILEADPSIGVVGGTAVLIGSCGVALGISPVADGWATFESLVRGNPFISPGQTLIRKDVLSHVNGLNPAIWGADDYDLWLKIARLFRIRTIDRPALMYRKHSTNSSRSAGRLFHHTEAVIRAHLPHLSASARKSILPDVYRNLYWWLGQSFVWNLKSAAKCGDVVRAAKSLRDLIPLARPICRDSFLCKQILSDLLAFRMLKTDMRNMSDN